MNHTLQNKIQFPKKNQDSPACNQKNLMFIHVHLIHKKDFGIGQLRKK